MRGIDYSGGRPGGAAIVADGYQFVMRYLWHETPKGVDELELEDLRAHNLAVGFVFESSEDRAITGGFGGGVSDATYARNRAEHLGIPDDVVIHFAVDTGTTEDDWPAIAAYFAGVFGVMGPGRVGAYAGKQVSDYLRERGLITHTWQPAAMSWSNYEIDPLACIRQSAEGGAVNGVGIDPNESFGDDLGLWLPDEPMEEGMTPEERDLLLKTATVLAGWSDGTDFKSVEEALAQMTAMANDQVLALIRIDDLRDQVASLTLQVATLVGDPSNPQVERNLDRILAALEALGATLSNVRNVAPAGGGS